MNNLQTFIVDENETRALGFRVIDESEVPNYPDAIWTHEGRWVVRDESLDITLKGDNDGYDRVAYQGDNH